MGERMQCADNQIQVRPFLKWAGGKRWFANRFKSLLKAHGQNYVEPFLGSGAVYFSVNPSNAIVSDINCELINTYIALRDNAAELVKILAQHQKRHSKEYYYHIRAIAKESSGLKRAANFIYLNRTCWNGLYRVNKNGMFNVPKGTKDTVVFPGEDFTAYSKYLKNAQIFCCDFEETIERANPGDLLFVDPPYTVKHNNNCFVKYNENLFNWKDQVRLRDALVKAQSRGCKIIATNAAHESIKELYAAFFKIEEVERQSVIAGSSTHRKVCSELLIRGNV